MLRRNLIVIATMVLGLGITSAFGQAREAGSGMATGVKAKPTSGKGMRDAASGMATGIKARKTTAKSLCENQTIDGKSRNARTRKTTANSLCENQIIPWTLRTRRSSGLTYQKIETVKKPSNWSFGESYPQGAKAKQPRRRSTQKRQHKP